MDTSVQVLQLLQLFSSCPGNAHHTQADAVHSCHSAEMTSSRVGRRVGRSTLSQYNLQTGVETGRMSLDRKPDGMAPIVLNGRQCVALAYT